MSLILAAATRKELEAALSFAGALPDLAPGRPAPFPELREDVLLLITGVGPVNAALSLGEALGLLRGRTPTIFPQSQDGRGETTGPLSGVLNLGLAGSFDLDRLGFGASVAVAREIWPEYGLRDESGVDARALKFPLWRSETTEVWESLDLDPASAASAMGLRLPREWPSAASLSVAGVTAAPACAQAMRLRHAVDLENMEGFALALGCLRAGLPFLEIRTVSNLVGSRRAGDWNLETGLAALAGVAKTLFSRV